MRLLCSSCFQSSSWLSSWAVWVEIPGTRPRASFGQVIQAPAYGVKASKSSTPDHLGGASCHEKALSPKQIPVNAFEELFFFPELCISHAVTHWMCCFTFQSCLPNSPATEEDMKSSHLMRHIHLRCPRSLQTLFITDKINTVNPWAT